MSVVICPDAENASHGPDVPRWQPVVGVGPSLFQVLAAHAQSQSELEGWGVEHDPTAHCPSLRLRPPPEPAVVPPMVITRLHDRPVGLRVEEGATYLATGRPAGIAGLDQ